MASVRFEKGSHEWCMFQDLWKLCQKFWIPENDDKYWENVVAETDGFYKKYKDIALAKDMAVALVSYLEGKAKGDGKQNGGAV